MDALKRAVSFAVVVGLVGCIPELADDRARVTTPRVLAVRAVPPEAKPGEAVSLEALVASATADGAVPTWALCLARKPLTELGPVAEECLEGFAAGASGGSSSFVPLGRGATTLATIPADACQRFGPLRPPADASGVSARAVDPDPTGGYHQPVVLGLDAARTLASVRLACGAAGLPNADVVRFTSGYRPNENPALERVEVTASGVTTTLPAGGDGVAVGRGRRVELRAIWAACPRSPVCGDGLCTAGENASSCAADCRDAPRGCTGAESYLHANVETRTVDTRREGIRIAWYATAGTFRDDQSGRSEEDDDLAFAANDWTAPDVPGVVRLWFVVRDDRGGVGFREGVLRVE